MAVTQGTDEVFFTKVDVGVKSQSAVLYVKGEGVDVEVAGADDSDRLSIVHLSITVQVDVWDGWGCVLIHTVRTEQEEKVECLLNKSNGYLSRKPTGHGALILL